MSITEIKRVAYVALGARDLDAQRRFYCDLVGLGETDRDGEGRVYLRCDRYHHALVLVEGEPGILHYGLDVGGEAELEAAADRLEEAKIEHREVTPLTGQSRALELVDPAGIAVRLVACTAVVDPSYGPRAVQPRKFSHLNLLCSDPAETERFYREALAFRVSDVVAGIGVWMRCNPDHHGVAYGGSSLRGMQHLAFEATTASDLLRQADHLARHGHRLAWGPGRHGPGNNLFVYFLDPERNVIELTAEMEQIWHDEDRPPAWNPVEDPHWANLWGQPPTPEFLANAMTPEQIEALMAGRS